MEKTISISILGLLTKAARASALLELAREIEKKVVACGDREILSPNACSRRKGEYCFSFTGWFSPVPPDHSYRSEMSLSPYRVTLMVREGMESELWKFKITVPSGVEVCNHVTGQEILEAAEAAIRRKLKDDARRASRLSLGSRKLETNDREILKSIFYQRNDLLSSEKGRQLCEELKQFFAWGKESECEVEGEEETSLLDDIRYEVGNLPLERSIKALVVGALPNLWLL
jgi:hypothetical protein